MNIRLGIGAYRQADLEGMSRRDLMELRGWAADRFNEHLERHDKRGEEPEGCHHCEYYEMLAGACDDVLARTPGEGCIVDEHGNVSDAGFHAEILGEDL